jgi:transcriptional regulator with XRE-family HTH domain
MRDKILAQSFGLTIRRLRQEAGFSQEELAELCRLHRTYIGSIERGEKAVTIETSNKLAKALQISLSHLFAQVESQQLLDRDTDVSGST